MMKEKKAEEGKKLYFALVNKKAELAGGVLYSLLILSYPWIFKALEAMIGYRFGSSNQIYICRISFLFLLCGLLALARYQAVSFLKKNWESLMLLGVSGLEGFLLFLSANTKLFFLQIYCGTMLFQMQGIRLGFALSVQAVYGICVCAAGMLLGLKAHGKILTFLSAAAIGCITVFFGIGHINYQVMYKWVMGESAGKRLFSENPCVTAVLLILALSLVWLAACLYESADMPRIAGSWGLFFTGRKAEPDKSFFRVGRFRLSRYFWMYRSREFFLWKLCSMLFLALVCCLGDSSFAVFLTAYGICLLTAFYFKDIYNLERKKLLIYFMSDYPYRKFFPDVVKEGTCLLGDQIFLILVLFRLRNFTDCITFLFVTAAVLSIAIFVNASLFAKYPRRQYQIGVCSALIKLHLPVGNLFFLYQWILQGKKNWEHLSYEYRS